MVSSNTITLDDMPCRTFTRKQLLVSFLSRLRSKRTGHVFLESRGEGVRKILGDGAAHSGRRPEYELFGDEFRLTLWGNRPPPIGCTHEVPAPRPSRRGSGSRHRDATSGISPRWETRFTGRSYPSSQSNRVTIKPADVDPA